MPAVVWRFRQRGRALGCFDPDCSLVARYVRVVVGTAHDERGDFERPLPLALCRHHNELERGESLPDGYPVDWEWWYE